MKLCFRVKQTVHALGTHNEGHPKKTTVSDDCWVKEPRHSEGISPKKGIPLSSNELPWGLRHPFEPTGVEGEGGV